jgi:hypothetical protein
MFTGVETEGTFLNQQRRLILAAYVAAGQDESQHTWNSLREHHLDMDLVRVAPAIASARPGTGAEGLLQFLRLCLGHITDESTL